MSRSSIIIRRIRNADYSDASQSKPYISCTLGSVYLMGVYSICKNRSPTRIKLRQIIPFPNEVSTFQIKEQYRHSLENHPPKHKVVGP
jgi:hypothetical protein